MLLLYCGDDMKYCNNCGNELNENSTFCPKCGNNIYNVNQTQVINYEQRKKNNNSYLSVFATGALIIVTAIFLFIVCCEAGSSDRVDGSVSGLYILFGFPIGLIMCEPLLVINLILNFIGEKKQKIGFPIAAIVLYILNIICYLFFLLNFATGKGMEIIFFGSLVLYILLSLGAAAISIFKIVKLKK